MPELPDVEGWKRYVNRFARGATIQGVRVPEPSVLVDTSPQGLGRGLHRRTLHEGFRRGKWLVVPTDGPALALHFGMTGALAYTRQPTADHPHDRVVLELGRGRLAYRSQRMFGSVALVPDASDLDRVTGPLGPDADALDRAGLATLLEDRRGGVKAALMDQELLAGLGNELSDEVLWRSRLHPDTPVRSLDDEQITALCEALDAVLRASKRHGRIPRETGWLEEVRGTEDARCPRCGASLRTTRSAGRTAYLCPKEQRAP